MSKLVRYSPPRPPSMRERVAEALRSYWVGPRYSGDPALKEFFGSGTTSATGISVTETTAMNYAAVWAAVNCIAGDISSLPLLLMKRGTGGKGKERMTGNALYRLLHDRPNAEMTSVVWRKTMQGHAMTWGNGYSEIVRNGAGKPTAFWPLTPDRVTAFRRSVDAPLQYRIAEPGGGESFLADADMIHIGGLSYNGVCGYSVIQKARESLGLLAAAEKFGGTFFGNGSTFGGVIAYPGPRPPELADKNYREAFNLEHQGVERAHKFLALYGGATYARLGIPPNDAQFLETRQFQINEIARWFNLPPHKIGDLARATFSNIEQQAQDYVTNTLLPWLEVWEQELLVKLVPESEWNIQLIEHVLEGLLRGDSAARGAFYNQRFQVASITPNEIRELENQNPIDGGDRPFVNSGMIPLDRVDEWVTAQIEAKKAPAAAPQPTQPTAQDTQLQQTVHSLNTELELARRKAQEAEDAMDRAKSEADALRVEWLKAQKARDDEAARADTADGAYRYLTTESVVRQTNLQADLDAAVAERDAVRALHSELAVEVPRAMEQRDKFKASLESASVEISRLVAVTEGLSLDVMEAQRMTTAAEQKTSTADAVIVELRAQIATLTTDGTETAGQLVDVRDALVRAQAGQDSHGQQLDAAKAETAEKLAEVLALQDRAIQTQAALRGVLTDAVGRLIAREADRARKASGSPEKLAKWVENFYPMHADVCRAGLRPAVRAWLIASGKDTPVDQVLDALIPAYLDESTRSLNGVLIDTDQDSLAQALEKILRRWESDRADATVDRLLKEAA